MYTESVYTARIVPNSLIVILTSCQYLDVNIKINFSYDSVQIEFFSLLYYL